MPIGRDLVILDETPHMSLFVCSEVMSTPVLLGHFILKITICGYWLLVQFSVNTSHVLVLLYTRLRLIPFFFRYGWFAWIADMIFLIR